MNDEKIFAAALKEFDSLKIKAVAFEKIREKDGVALIRIKTAGKSYVFKYFEKEEYRREIKIYKILNSLEIETIPAVAFTEKSILMEDIAESKNLRLGTEEDMSDPEVAKALAKWYKNLHKKGYDYIAENGADFYSENAFITRENIAFIKSKTDTEGLFVWKLIEENFDKLKAVIDSEKQTFNYNDFYYANLVVSKDKTKAFMFDYNLFGKGAAVSDINNVCWSLAAEAKAVFLDAYGETDEKEKLIEEVAMILSSLYFACKREDFPDWGVELLEELKNGYSKKLKRLLSI